MPATTSSVPSIDAASLGIQATAGEDHQRTDGDRGYAQVGEGFLHERGDLKQFGDVGAPGEQVTLDDLGGRAQFFASMTKIPPGPTSSISILAATVPGQSRSASRIQPWAVNGSRTAATARSPFAPAAARWLAR